jgi:two-component system nitrate/nitrite response regulator NarL
MSPDAGMTPRRRAAKRGTRTSRPAARAAERTSVAPPQGPASDGLSVLIASRPALFREILARQLGSEPGLRIAGQARDEESVRSILIKDKPRVLVLDYEGFGPNAEALIPRFRRASPATRILVLAARSGDETVERVLRVGASGLVGKQHGFAPLVRAIRLVANGELWANRRVTARAVEHLADRSGRDSVGEPLTSRETEIAEAVGRGLRNKEIARRLQVSEKTVKSHLSNIFRKLQVDNRFAVGLYVLDLQPRPSPS